MTTHPYPIGLRYPAPHDTRRLPEILNKAGIALPPAPDVQANYSAIHNWRNFGNGEPLKKSDCTCAAIGNIIVQWSGLTHTQIQDAAKLESEIEEIYDALVAQNKYRPPQLLNPTKVLDYWTQTRIGGIELQDFALIDHTDDQAVRDAIYWFGNVYAVVQLPRAATSTGAPWRIDENASDADSKPDHLSSHAVPIVGYSPRELTFVTWGAIKHASWDFWRAYRGEAFVLLSPAWTLHTQAPGHADYDKLFDYLRRERHHAAT